MNNHQIRLLSNVSPNSKPSFDINQLVGALFMFDVSGSLMMQLRDNKKYIRYPSTWVPPGGHIEDMETLADGVKREFLEETDYYCETIEWYNAFEIIHPIYPPYKLGVFWAIFDNKQAFRCLEGQILRFVKRDEVELLNVPDFIISIWDEILLENKLGG